MNKLNKLKFLLIFLIFMIINGVGYSQTIGCMTISDYAGMGAVTLDVFGGNGCADATNGNDKLTVTGDLSLASGATITVNLNHTGSPGFSLSDMPSMDTFETVIIEAGNIIGSPFTTNNMAALNALMIDGVNAIQDLQFSLVYKNTDGDPEPEQVILRIIDPCSPDATAPVATVPADQNLATNSNSCNLTNFVIPAPTGVSDACGGAVVTTVVVKNSSTGNQFNTSVGATGITLDTSNNLIIYTFTDGAGNVFKDTTNIRVTDQTNPSITCPANLTINSNQGQDQQAGDCSATVNWSTLTSSDNCPGWVVMPINAMGIVVADPIGTAFAVGTTTVRYKVTDAAGNTNSCSFSVTVVDVEAPTFAAIQNPLLTTSTTVSCPADAYMAPAILPSVSDNCLPMAAPIITITPSSLTCEGTVSHRYRWGATPDTLGWVFTYTVERNDFTIPDAIGQNTVACIADTAVITPPVVNDNCGTALTAVRQANSVTYAGCEGTVIRSWLYTDCEGNNHTWTHTDTVEVLDFTISTAIGQNTIACISDTVVVTPPVVEDNCGTALTAVRQANGGTYAGCEGTVVRSWLYTDCEGNNHTWTHTDTVEVLDFTISTAIGQNTIACISDTVVVTPPVVEDNCGTALTAVRQANSGTYAGCEGTVIRSWLYTDCEGNNHTWTHTDTVERNDFTISTQNGEATVACIGDTSMTVTPPTVIDNCGNNLTPVRQPNSGTYVGCEGTVIRSWLYTDCEGNNHTWTYTDTIESNDFTISTQNGEATVACIGDTSMTVTPPTVIDNCGNNLTPVRQPNSGTYVGCEGTVIRSWLYTDCEGNNHTWTYTDTIERNDFTISTQNGEATVACIGDTSMTVTPPTVTDNCGNNLTPIRQPNSGTYVNCEGTIIRSWLYTDCEGNNHTWTYTDTVEVLDFTISTTIGQNTIACISDTVVVTPPVVNDNCGAALTPVRQANSGTYVNCEGTIIRSWLYTDCEGNNHTWTHTDTVEVLDFTISTPFGQNTIACISDTAVVTPPVVNDICGAALTPVRQANSGTYVNCEGTIIRSWLYTDCEGNNHTWTHTDTIDDNTAPTAICDASTDITLGSTGTFMLDQLDIDALDNGSNDNCGGSLEFSLSNPNFNCDDSGVNDASGTGGNRVTRTLTVKDCAGNESSCVATFRIMPLDPTDASPANTTPNTCSDVPYTIGLQSFITNGVLADFNWTATFTGTLTGVNTSGSGDMITDTINNISATSGTITYMITPKSEATTCDGPNFTVTKVIRPEPVVANITLTACSDENLGGAALLPNTIGGVSIGNYRFVSLSHPNTTPIATNDGGNPNSNLISSYPYNLPGTIPNSSQITIGQRNDIENDVYNNVTSLNQNVIYTLIPFSEDFGCAGDTFTLIATINPEPVGINSPIIPICSGENFDIALDSFMTNDGVFADNSDDDVQDVLYAWTITSVNNAVNNNAISGALWPTFLPGALPTPIVIPIIGSLGPGAPITGDNIAQNITNGFGFDVIITYTVTPTSGFGCEGAPFTVKVRIHQNPDAQIGLNGDLTLCQNETRTLQAIATPSGPAYTYEWKVVRGNGTLSSASALNTVLTAGTEPNVTVQLKITHPTSGCMDSITQTFIITNNPTFAAGEPADLDTCALTAGGTSAQFNLNSSVTNLAGITFYTSQAGADAGTGNITNTTNYTGTNGQVLYARLDSAGGCYAVESFALTVNPLPTTSITGTLTICAGGSTTLTATGSYTFKWSDNSTASTLEVSTSGIYTVTATDANGCTSSASATVVVNPKPEAVITASDLTVCAGEEITLSTGGGQDYTWYAGSTPSGTPIGTAATINVTPTTTGDYTVVVSTAFGCKDTATISITVAAGIPMVVNCPLNKTLYVQDCDISQTWVAPSISDGCTTTSLNVNLGGAENEGLAGGIQQANFDIGTSTVSYTNPLGGDTVACTFTITVVDTIKPTIICPPNLTVVDCLEDTVARYSGYLPFLADGGVLNDNCNISVSTWKLASANGLAAPPCVNRDTIRRVYEVSDIYGNKASCTQLVIIKDSIAPTFAFFPADTTIDCNSLQLPASTGGTPTATDNCDSGVKPITYTDASTKSSDPADVLHYNYVITRTWSAEDMCGNIKTQDQKITVHDTIKPIAICKNISVNLDPSGTASIIGSDVNDGSTDICAPQAELDFIVTPSTFDCTNVGIQNTVTLTVTDVVGNSSQCTANVTVVDLVPPVANCKPTFTVYLDASGMAKIDSNTLDLASTDNCKVDSFGVSKSMFDCTNTSSPISVTTTVYDSYRNSSTCVTMVTVKDEVKPIAICQDVIVSLDATGNGSTTAIAVNDGSSDACGISTMTVSPSFTCANVGSTNVVTLTVTDNNGNTETCTANVTVKDEVKPIAICQDVIVSLDATGNGSTTAAEVNDGSSDACGISTMTVSPSFTCANVGSTNVVTLTVTDNNGNTETCTANVTVKDEVAPTAVCKDTTVYLNASGIFIIDSTFVNNGSNDACGIVTIKLSESEFTCDDVSAANAVTVTVTDKNGNISSCMSNVTVKDTIDPMAICKDTIVYLSVSGSVTIDSTFVDNGSNDACGIASITLSKSTFTCTDIAGPNTITITVTDKNGNSSTCSTMITVKDTIDPVALCQPVTVNLDASGNGSTTAAAVNNGSNDACGTPTLSLNKTDFTCSDVGVNTVTLTVTDLNSNIATCTATVTVVDAIAPVAVCKDTTINLSATGTVSIDSSYVNNGSSDACGINTIVLSKTSFDCSNLGANTVTLVATDKNNNSSSCTATVTVKDVTAPVIDCPGNMTTYTPNPSSCFKDTSFFIANILDACTAEADLMVTSTAQLRTGNTYSNTGPVTIAYQPGTMNFKLDATGLRVGTNEIMIIAKDASGNADTCVFDINVLDVYGPIINGCPANVVVNATPGACQAPAIWNAPSISDPCDQFTPVISHTPGQNFAVGTTSTVTYSATDLSGNSSSCSFTVTVNGSCSPSPADLSPAILLSPSLFNVGQGRNFVVKVSNLGASSTSGTIQVFIPASSGYTISYNTALASVNTNVGTQAVSNSSWTAIPSGGGFIMSTNIVIPAGGFSQFGIRFTANTAMTMGNVQAILFPGSGGDVNSSNNGGYFGILTN